jgi:hypothetical protein
LIAPLQELAPRGLASGGGTEVDRQPYIAFFGSIVSGPEDFGGRRSHRRDSFAAAKPGADQNMSQHEFRCQDGNFLSAKAHIAMWALC